MGLNVQAGSSHDYGQCATTNPTAGPSQYEWSPDDCTLVPLHRPTACRLLSGKQIVFVGDSTTAQLFTSTVMLLEGQDGLGVDYRSGGQNVRKHPSVLSDVTASVCGDTVRLNFIRSDLLTWSNSGHEDTAIRKCNKKLKLNPFVARASSHADLLVLGTGLHVPASLPRVREGLSPVAARDTFFSQSLNHTLSSAVAARAARGLPPESVVLVGAGIPVPGCSRFSEPISAVHALGTSHDAFLNTWSDDWRDLHLINQAARWAAIEAGVGFIDVGLLAAQRPDAAMSRHVRVAALGSSEDCVHFCQPGPVDTWVQLIYNFWKKTSLATRRRQRLEVIRLDKAEPGKFFQSGRRTWLSAAGSAQARALEACPGPQRPCFACLADKWWWPYGNCTGVSERFVRANCARNSWRVESVVRRREQKYA